MNPNQILISVIDGFNMKPQEVVSLLESVKAEYYIRMTTPVTFGNPIGNGGFGVLNGTKPEKKVKKVKEKKKYNISEERRAQLRLWALKMREQKLAKKVEPKNTTTIPSKPETNLKDWADNLVMQNKMKGRLYNGLIKLHNRGFFLEDTHQDAFLDTRNVGMDSWKEFLKLRFAHFSEKK